MIWGGVGGEEGSPEAHRRFTGGSPEVHRRYTETHRRFTGGSPEADRWEGVKIQRWCDFVQFRLFYVFWCVFMCFGSKSNENE